MRIKAVCKKHPDSVVYLLTATTSYLDERGNLVSEALESATMVFLDEANLYCTYNPTADELEAALKLHGEWTHDPVFEVIEECSYDEKGDYKNFKWRKV